MGFSYLSGGVVKTWEIFIQWPWCGAIYIGHSIILTGLIIIHAESYLPRKGGSRFFLERGGPLTERGGGASNLGEILEILIANGAFLINLDHQLRAEISPIFSQYFS